jgi:hypothetical protein
MIDLPDVRDEVGLDPPRLLHELGEVVEQLFIGKRLEWVRVLHDFYIARAFFPASRRAQSANRGEDEFRASPIDSRSFHRL